MYLLFYVYSVSFYMYLWGSRCMFRPIFMHSSPPKSTVTVSIALYVSVSFIMYSVSCCIFVFSCKVQSHAFHSPPKAVFNVSILSRPSWHSAAPHMSSRHAVRRCTFELRFSFSLKCSCLAFSGSSSALRRKGSHIPKSVRFLSLFSCRRGNVLV